jgi:PKD repeat protein
MDPLNRIKVKAMKRTIITILLLAAMQVFGQFQGSISGTVTQDPSGTPVANQPVYLMILIDGDSLNIISDNVLTNASGIYSYSFSMTGSFARVDISTPNCNGTILTATGYINDSIQSILQDFIICTTTGCQAYFIYDQIGNFTFQFTDQSTGTGLNYSWDFGDNASSSSQNPEHTYNAPGIYEVCLSVFSSDSTCFDEFCTQVTVEGGGGCMAQYTYFPDSLQPGYSYQFIDLSSGNINGWAWDFGDGSYSQEQDPVHVFPDDGQYEVCLSVSGPDCQSTWCEVVNVSPIGDCYNYFTYQVEGLQVSFSSIHYPDIPADYIWDFGDGGSGTSQEVSHVYAQNGVYYVTLNTSDSAGCSATSSQAVVVGDTILFNQVYGQVFEGNFPMKSGYVILSSVPDNPAFTPNMDQVPVDTSGVFIFPYVPYGQYLLFAVPQDSSDYLPTYYGNVQHWPDATAFNAMETGMLYNINLSTAQSFPSAGDGSITGYITETSGRGDVLGMAQVILYNADFASLGFTSVQTDGSFSFIGLASGLYYILPELPGISSNLIAVEISDLAPACIVNLSFDGTTFLGLEDKGIMEETMKIGPNPASDHAFVSVLAKRQEQVTISITDLTGKVCFSGIYQVNSGDNSIALPVQKLQPGIYLVTLSNSSGTIQSVKFVRI